MSNIEAANDRSVEAVRAPPRFQSADAVMAILAVLVIVWAVARACLQSITMDEAMTYRVFVAPPDPHPWLPSSNNHLLTSLLMRLTTSFFGLSHLSVRLPSLGGACIYLVSCFFLCRSLIEERIVRVVILICLALNPFLCDFYVAARGYSLAAGFLACAIALVANRNLRASVTPLTPGVSPDTPIRSWVCASAAIGLSFVASFPFAFIDLSVWAGLLIWTLDLNPGGMRGRLRILSAAAIPGLLVVFLLASWTLLHWGKGELFDGARSLWETLDSIVQPSLSEPNADVANPLVLQAARFIKPYLVPALLGVAALQGVVLFILKRDVASDTRSKRRAELCILIAAASAAALLVHWLCFRLFGLLLPRNRTAIYLVPLATLMAGGVAGIRIPGNFLASACRGLLIAMLSVLGIYYATCLRANYFYEWWAWADVKDAYYVAAYYNHESNVTEVPSSLGLRDCLEFYRRLSGKETFSEFHETVPETRGQAVYVMFEPEGRDLIAREHLTVVYRGRTYRDLVVAVSPALAITSNLAE